MVEDLPTGWRDEGFGEIFVHSKSDTVVEIVDEGPMMEGFWTVYVNNKRFSTFDNFDSAQDSALDWIEDHPDGGDIR